MIQGSSVPGLVGRRGDGCVLRSAMTDAFILVGALREPLSVGVLQRYRNFVVDAVGGGSGISFVILKLLHSGAGLAIDSLEQDIESILSPAAMQISSIDEAALHWGNMSTNMADCLWPPRFGHYLRDDSRRLLKARLARWWGALQMAHELVATHERKHTTAFRRVVITRADMQFLAPVEIPRGGGSATESIWFSASNPPDAFWVMPRRVAEHALQSARTAAECIGAMRSHAQAPDARPYLFSWFIPCFWTRQLWARGVRLQLLGGLNATAALHPTHDQTSVLVSASSVPDEVDVSFDSPGDFPVPQGEGYCSPWNAAEGNGRSRRLSRRVSRHPRRWLTPARVGFCHITSEGASDCARGERGSWSLNEARDMLSAETEEDGVTDGASNQERREWASSSAQRKACAFGQKPKVNGTARAVSAECWRLATTLCIRRCEACARCRAISLSPAWGDCSWFATCSMEHLSKKVPGFVTAPGDRLCQGEVGLCGRVGGGTQS